MKITIKIIFFISVISLYTYGGYKTGFIAGKKYAMEKYIEPIDSLDLAYKMRAEQVYKLINDSIEINNETKMYMYTEEFLNHSEIK